MMRDPVPVGIVGLGGFATVHHRVIQRLEGEGAARLIATCDPRAAELLPTLADLRLDARGVAVLPDLAALLARHGTAMRLITIPTPVPLHAPMHRVCVEAGIPVYLEKPPTLDPEELEGMIAVDAAARRPTWVGFNFIRDPIRQRIKRDILAGVHGRLRAVRVAVNWQRTDTYYQRAAWAGRLLLDGRLVLDGPLGNAMAHFVHDALHWAGSAQDAWAVPQRVRAMLLRAHRIEGADTVLAEIDTGGADIRIAVTHAGGGKTPGCETLVCDEATIHILPDERMRARIVRPGRADELITDPDPQPALENLRAACALADTGDGRPATTLADSRSFVHLNALAHLSTGAIGQEPACAGTIPGILDLGERFLTEGILPALPWAPSPRWVTAADLPRLRAAVEQLAARRPSA